MVESIAHFCGFPDPLFKARAYLLDPNGANHTLEPGGKYKDLVNKESKLLYFFEFREKLEREMQRYQCLISERFSSLDPQLLLENDLCDSTKFECLKDLLLRSESLDEIHNHLNDFLLEISSRMGSDFEENFRNRFTNHLGSVVKKTKCFDYNLNFIRFERSRFNQIILCNLGKADFILHTDYTSSSHLFQKASERCAFTDMRTPDLTKILSKQWDAERELNKIWVLNTSVFLVVDFNRSLITESPNLCSNCKSSI